MSRLKIDMEHFGPALRRRIRQDAEKARRAAHETCLRVESAAVDETRRQQLVDLAHYMWGWWTSPTMLNGNAGFRVGNDYPYAGVIEHGRRPGRPGPPVEPIREWVRRKLVGNGVVTADEADQVAFLIRRSIHLKGTKPRHVFRAAARNMRAWFGEELRRRLRR